MIELYCLFILMFLAALSIVAIPFLMTHQSLISRPFLILILFIGTFSFVFYAFTGNSLDLKLWLTEGREHYLLQEKFDDLGGVEGVIARIKVKLKAHPDDAKGWFILGKLYKAKQDEVKAKEAFQKAHLLQPQDKEMTYYAGLQKG